MKQKTTTAREHWAVAAVRAVASRWVSEPVSALLRRVRSELGMRSLTPAHVGALAGEVEAWECHGGAVSWYHLRAINAKTLEASVYSSEPRRLVTRSTLLVGGGYNLTTCAYGTIEV